MIKVTEDTPPQRNPDARDSAHAKLIISTYEAYQAPSLPTSSLVPLQTADLTGPA